MGIGEREIAKIKAKTGSKADGMGLPGKFCCIIFSWTRA